MVQQSKPTYEFGPFLLDAKERMLLKNGQPVPLTPKAFDTLLVLVQNSGHALEKDELMKAVWPDTFVEEVNLAHNISVLRKALGEGPNGDKFIETVPRRGYRFVGRVRELREESSRVLIEERALSSVTIEEQVIERDDSSPRLWLQWNARWKALAALIVLVGLAIVAVYFFSRGTPNPGAIRSIAVLPFEPLSAESSDESLEMGMADTLIMRLSSIREIIVRPTSAVRKYTRPEQDAVTAGQELGVDAVLDGSIQKINDRIRVTARLVKVQDGTTLWAAKFDENLTNTFAVQDSISERVATALELTLTGEERAALAKRYTNNTEAYRLYLLGRYSGTRERRRD